MIPRLVLPSLLALLPSMVMAQRAERGGQDAARARAGEEPPTAAEVDAALKELKKSRRAGDRNRNLTVVLRSDSADGRRYVSNMLREVAGLSYEEIGLSCEITVDAVRSRLHRARQQLRIVLQPLVSNGGTPTVRLYDPR